MDYGYKKVSDINTNNEGGNYGKFGINEATLASFEYTNEAGSGGTSGEAVDIKFKVGEKDFLWRVFPPKTFSTADPSTEEYKKSQKQAEDQFVLALSQLTEAFVNPTTIQGALLASKPTNFKDYIELMGRLIKNTPNWNQKQLDLFLQWQSKPGANQTKTYLEVPRVYNLKFGNEIYVTAKQEGNYTKDASAENLVYKNESGEKHPITRTKWWVENSANAKRINLEEGSNPQNEFMPGTEIPETPATEENW